MRRARVLACLVPAILAFGTAQAWFEPGHVVAQGDVTPSWRPGWEGQYASHWNDLLGPGAPSYSIVYLPEAAFARTAHAAGLDDSTTQRLWISLLYAAAAASMAFLALGLGMSPLASGAAALLAIINVYVVIQQVSSPFYVIFGTSAFLGGVVVRAAKGQLRRAPVIFALGTAGMGHAFINPPLVAMMIVWVAIIVLTAIWLEGRAGARRLGRLALIAAPLTLLVNAWWLVPAWLTIGGSGSSVARGTFSAQTDVIAWAWTHKKAGLGDLMGLSGTWSWRDPTYSYYPFSTQLDTLPFSLLRYLLPLFAFAAPVLAKGKARRVALALSAAALGAIWIAKGLHGPLSASNLFLYKNIPGFWLLREPVTKALFLASLAFALLAGISLQALAARVRWTWLRPASVAVPVVAMIAAAYPLVTGDYVPDRAATGRDPDLPSAHVRIPDDWKAAADYLNSLDEPGKVLVLPLADFYQMPTTWGYYGVDLTASILVRRPVFAVVPSGYYSPPGAVTQWIRSIEASLLGNETVDMRSSMAALGIRYVLLRHDLDRTWPGRTFTDPKELDAPLAATPGITRVRRFGFLDLYRVEGASEVYAATQIVRFRGSQDLLPVAVGALPGGTVIADLDSNDLPLGGDAFAFDIRSLASEDRPSEVSGSGGYRIVPTRRYGTLVAVRVVRSPAGDVVVSVVDDVKIRIGNELQTQSASVAARFVSVSADAAIRVGGRIVFLRDLASDGIAGRQVIRDAFPVEAYEPRPPRRLTRADFGPVGDCYRIDPRSPTELGLSLRPIQDGFQLRASDHSACVSAGLEPKFDPNAVYRVQLQHRSVSGEPARICLWQDGPDRCAPTQSLRSSTAWTSYEETLKPEAGTKNLRLFLYADASGGRETASEYRDIEVQRYERTAATIFRQPVGRSRELLNLGAGQSARVVVEPAFGVDADRNLLEPHDVQDLGDCFESDSRTLEQAGIAARQIPGDPRILELRARVHAACIYSYVKPFEANAVYRVQLEYRSLSGRPARMCLWQDGVDSCIGMNPLGSSRKWATFDAAFAPDPRAKALRLFLYADGDAGITRTQYRNVTVRKLAPAEFAVVPTRAASNPPMIKARRIGPSKFHVQVTNASTAFVLYISETFAADWRLLREGKPSRGAKHIRVNGYANGWLVPWTGTYDLTLEYEPESAAVLGKRVSLVALGGLPLLALPVTRRRRPTASAVTAEPANLG